MTLILAAFPWPNNSSLLADVAQLYISSDDIVFDTTPGKGNWWKEYRPVHLLDPSDFDFWKESSFDFCDMHPLADNFADVVAFDPPYVSIGGRQTTTIEDMHRAFGMDTTPKNPAGLQLIIDAGLFECRRITAPQGLILVKCMDYISSGKYWPGTFKTLRYAFSIDLELIDRFEMIRTSAPQSQTAQVHARRNHSTLFVLRKQPCSDCGSYQHFSSMHPYEEAFEQNDEFASRLDID